MWRIQVGRLYAVLWLVSDQEEPDLDNSATLRAGQNRYSILVGCSVVAEFPLWLMYIINLMFNSSFHQ